MRANKDSYYCNIAVAVAERSTCLRRKYGAVIVKDDVIVSTGYNGAPRGRANCCDIGTCKRASENILHGERYELCRSVHAEQNAIIAAGYEKTNGATLYLAHTEEIILGTVPIFGGRELRMGHNLPRLIVTYLT